VNAQRRLHYEAEIRDYLLGRLSHSRTTLRLEAPEWAELPTTRILDWWIFEGKCYQGLDRPLALGWDQIYRAIRLLLASYNPRWRHVATPEGEVDWFATALAKGTNGRPEFVCRTTHVGISEAEREALIGWQRWISRRWSDYVQHLGHPAGSPSELPWPVGAEADFRMRQLQRWAHAARRSRWPLLRNIVAESLRAAFEPQYVQQLPLPADDAKLFEIVCVVRVLTALEPSPASIRWLDLEAGQNTIRTRAIACRYQLTLERRQVLESGEFAPALARALERYAIQVPTRMDAIIDLSPPQRFEHLILEMKSGDQSYDKAVYQLKCYRAALGESPRCRLVLWGIIEDDTAATSDPRLIASIAEEALNGTDDVWVFSPANHIGVVVGALALGDAGVGAIDSLESPRRMTAAVS
jgi:hypothetical protein